jgi:acyl carrier protein
MDQRRIADELLSILTEYLEWPLPSQGELRGIPIADDGLALDSISMIDFCLCIERRFSFRIPDEDIPILAKGTINDAATYVAARI